MIGRNSVMNVVIMTLLQTRHGNVLLLECVIRSVQDSWKRGSVYTDLFFGLHNTVGERFRLYSRMDICV